MHFQKSILFIICCLVTPFYIFSGQEIVRLQFIPNTSVHHISEINGSFKVEFGDISSSSTFEQVLNGSLLIDSDDIDILIESPPINMVYVFTGFRAKVQNEGGCYKINTDFPEDSISAEALSKLINHPIQLHFGKDFVLEKGSQELQVLQQKMGVFEDFDYSDVLEDLFHDFFILADRDLSVGTKVTLGDVQVFDIEVTAITEKEIQADIKCNLNSQSMEWIEDEAHVSIEITGDVGGQIVWKRSNALEYRAVISTDLSSKMNVEGVLGSVKTQFIHKACTFR